MVRRSGRITESWLIVRVFLRTAMLRLLGMSKLGLRLFLAGRMNVRKERIERRQEMVALLDSVAATRKELAL